MVVDTYVETRERNLCSSFGVRGLGDSPARFLWRTAVMIVTSIWKRILCVVVLAGSCAVANATTTALGPLSAGAPVPFSGTVVPSGPFLDIFTFTLPANDGSGYSVINFPLSIPEVGTFDTAFNSLALFSNPDGILFNSDDQNVKMVSGTGANALSFTVGPSSGGSMYLMVDGIAKGTIGGLYNGAISVSAIPEPAVLFLMASGIGLIGFLKLRSRDQVIS